MRKIYSTLLNASIILVTIAPVASAADVRGVFKYQDTTTVVPIRRAYVEVWYHGTGFFDLWNVVGTTTTDDNGRMSYMDSSSNGTFSLRIYAMNDAAIVWPTDIHITPFYAVSVQRSPSTANAVLDFSATFSDAPSTQAFNLANTAQLGLKYANARRDPLETDVIAQVNIQPTSWFDRDSATYYDPGFHTIMVQTSAVFEDLVILHEYGHHLQTQISRVTGWPSYHDGCAMRLSKGGLLINSPEYAWTEGFAEYFSRAVVRAMPAESSLNGNIAAGGTFSVSALESPVTCSVIGSSSQAGTITPAMVELNIAAALWDLVDSLGQGVPLLTDLEAGVTLSDAFLRQEKVFGKLFVSSIKTGEATGHFLVVAFNCVDVEPLVDAVHLALDSHQVFFDGVSLAL